MDIPCGGQFGRLKHMNASWPYKFTGKERDSESGMDNFGGKPGTDGTFTDFPYFERGKNGVLPVCPQFPQFRGEENCPP